MSHQTRVQIKHLNFSYNFGRPVAQAQLCDDQGQLLSTGSLSEHLTYINQHELILENAQEVLDKLVRENGFAA